MAGDFYSAIKQKWMQSQLTDFQVWDLVGIIFGFDTVTLLCSGVDLIGCPLGEYFSVGVCPSVQVQREHA